MRAVHFDPFSGASGDMVLGALADAGGDTARLEETLRRSLPFGLELRAEKVVRNGIAGTRLAVSVEEEKPPRCSQHPRRGLREILGILAAADLPPRVRGRAESTFRALAEAEAAVHGTGAEEVHFHELGAGDALVDVIGAHWLLEELGVERATSGPVAVGSGTVSAAHGELPLPAPATARLLEGAPLRGSPGEGELTTPTGAAILRTVCSSFGPIPPMRLEMTGYGFGSREGGPLPNALRVFLGEAESPSGPSASAQAGEEEVAVLETTVDDMPGEWLGRLFEALPRAGALEVSTTPVGMKKSRPGVRVTVVARVEDSRRLAEALLRETTSFGVRLRTERRLALGREHHEVETPWGRVRLKVGRLGDEEFTCSPEYEDARRVAEDAGVPLKEVYESALAAYRRAAGPGRSLGPSC